MKHLFGAAVTAGMFFCGATAIAGEDGYGNPVTSTSFITHQASRPTFQEDTDKIAIFLIDGSESVKNSNNSYAIMNGILTAFNDPNIKPYLDSRNNQRLVFIVFGSSPEVQFVMTVNNHADAVRLVQDYFQSGQYLNFSQDDATDMFEALKSVRYYLQDHMASTGAGIPIAVDIITDGNVQENTKAVRVLAELNAQYKNITFHCDILAETGNKFNYLNGFAKRYASPERIITDEWGAEIEMPGGTCSDDGRFQGIKAALSATLG